MSILLQHLTHLRSSSFYSTDRQAAAAVLQLKRPTSNSEMTAPEQRFVDCQFKPRALVVDDSADIAFMLLTIVQHAGYETVMAVSAVEALALAEQEHFDLVISDIGMPDMDGYALARALRALPGYSTTAMIAVTGFAHYDDRERALGAGFNTHLKKPLDPGKLIETIRDLRR
jgi:CheY-like chemotaxis protein